MFVLGLVAAMAKQQFAIFGAIDDIGLGTDHLHAVFFKNAVLGERLVHIGQDDASGDPGPADIDRRQHEPGPQDLLCA